MNDDHKQIQQTSFFSPRSVNSKTADSASLDEVGGHFCLVARRNMATRVEAHYPDTRLI